MAVKFSNNASTTLSAGISSGVTSFQVASNSGFPTLGGSDWTYVTIDTEVVKVTAISGTTFTCDTTGEAHSNGDNVELRMTAELLNDFAEDTEALPLAGGTMTGTTAHGDNVQSTWGTGGDLVIYHHPSNDNSYIQETGAGNLMLLGTNIQLMNAAGTENKLFASSDGAVTLYYDNATKLATTSTGFKLTGTAGTSPLLELNNADTEDTDTGRESSLRFTGNRSGGEDVINAQISGSHDGSADDDKGMLLFYTNDGSSNTEAMRIDSDGKIGIGGITNDVGLANLGSGTAYNVGTKGIYWNCSEASKYTAIFRNGADPAWGIAVKLGISAPDTSDKYIDFIDDQGTVQASFTGTGHASAGLGIQTGGTTAITINESQHVGIGATTNLNGALTVFNGQDFNTLSSTTTDNIYLISDATSGDGIYGASIGFSRVEYPDRRGAAIASVQKGSDEDNVGLAFFTHPSATSTDPIVEAMRIDSDGNVGIGTDNPTAELDVRASIGDSIIRAVGIEGNHAALELWGDDGDDATDGFQILGGANNDGLYFRTSKTAGLSGSYSWDTRMIIKASGNVVMGSSTTGEAPLHLNYANGSYGSEATSGFISNATSGRGTIRIRSADDEAAELFYDIDGAVRWDVSVRPSNETYVMKWYPQGASPSLVGVSSSVMDLSQAGDLTLSAGNLVIGTAGKGIDFSAQTSTTSGTVASGGEVLDHYEEGTWTPLVGGWSDSVTKTASASNQGHYTRIGNRVFVNANVQWDGTETVSGGVIIRGLPFTSDDTVGNRWAGSMAGTTGITIDMTNGEYLTLGMDRSATYLYIIEHAVTGYAHSPAISDTGNIFGLEFSYQAA